MTTSNDTPLLTVADVCRRLKMGKSKVFHYLGTGELESFKLGNSRRVTEEQLQAFIVSQMGAPR